MPASEAGVVDRVLPRDCETCQGTGEIDLHPHRRAPEGSLCPTCRGTGREPCAECGSAVATVDDPDGPGGLCAPCAAHMGVVEAA